MKQLTKTQSVIYHLYPGISITAAFVVLGPLSIRHGYPPQFGMLIAVLLVAIPILTIHLLKAKRDERSSTILPVNNYTGKLSTFKLTLYAILLVAAAFLLWGVTQPISNFMHNHVFAWLPRWFTVQTFAGYSLGKLRVTLIFNLMLNGIVAPVAEELYFRGYLLPRMECWGKYAFIMEAILFALYHLWQPYIYITLIAAMLPMIYMITKTKDLRLGILTHALLNLTGAILSFAYITQ